MAKDFWAPNSDKQKTFMGLPSDISEALYGGAVMGGKTEALIMLPVVYPCNVTRSDGSPLRLFEHPQFKGIFFRKTYKQLDEEIVKRMKDIYVDKLGATFREKPSMRFTFPSGAQMFLSYLETNSDAEAHDTAQYNLVLFEELTHFKQYPYLYLMSRCRTTTTDLPAIMRSTATPGNIGHTWVKNRFITPDILPAHLREQMRSGGKIIFDPKTNTNRIFIKAIATDNVDAMAANPDYLNKLRNLPPALAKARIEGDWDAFSGQVFEEFRSIHLEHEPDNAIHVIPKFTIPWWWPKIIAIDWGYRHKTVILFGAIAPDGRVYVFKEIVAQKEYIETWVARLVAECAGIENIVEAVIDPSANQQRGEPLTIKQQVSNALAYLNIPLADAINDRIGGKTLLHEYLRWDILPDRYVPEEGFNYDTYMKLLRNFGENRAKEYEKLFQPEEKETNLPKLQIFENCSELIRCIPEMVYAEPSKSDESPEDVAKVDGDDAYDCIRYLLKRAHLFMNMSQRNEQRHQELAKIQQAFEVDHDYTKHHNRMAFFNKTAEVTILPPRSRVFRNSRVRAFQRYN